MFGDVSPHDTARVFAATATRELVVAAALFRVATMPAVMRPLRWAVGVAVEGGAWWGAPVRAATRVTLFRQFCAGEQFADVAALAGRWHGVRLIVDHSVEEREDPGAWADNLQHKEELLQRCRDALGGVAGFVPVKVTALASPELLERLTTQLTAREGWESTPLIGASPDQDPPLPKLTDADAELLRASEANLAAICAAAERAGVPLLLDAEQTHRQPAIDLLTLRLMRRFNKRGRPAMVYNTYQMYLRDATPRLRRDMASAAAAGFPFAAKVVRGAYIATEKARAESLGVKCPILATKEDTDAAYDDAIAEMVRAIAADADSCAVIVATHNTASVARCCDEMERAGLPRNHPSVNMAQIMGMCDNVTLALAAAGYNSHKLALYGDFGEIVPWLLRRMDENGDGLSAMTEERRVLSKEVWRRLNPLRRLRALQ